MRSRWLMSLVVLLVVSALASAHAQDHRSLVVVTVGARKITAGEIEDRLAAIPRFQLLTLGSTPDAMKKKFLDQVIVPEALLSLGAEQRKVDRTLPTSYDLERVYAEATLRAEREKTVPAAKIPLEDVKAYFEANRSLYDAPDRYGIWRIACKTRSEAAAVIEQLAKSPKDKAEDVFRQLAREHSVDKGTFMRGGNLGFVTLDGASNEPGLKVDPALPKAAAEVKNGDVVPTPVEEGQNFSVVWRRTFIGASHRSVDDVAAQIRDTLWTQRKELAEKKLIDDLRARDLRDLDETGIFGFTISVTDGNIAPRGRPGQVAPQK